MKVLMLDCVEEGLEDLTIFLHLTLACGVARCRM